MGVSWWPDTRKESEEAVVVEERDSFGLLEPLIT
jgi:hypothetical protein